MKILSGLGLALAALWCGGWFVLANLADSRIVEAIETQRKQGVEINCTDRQMRGFPLTMGFECDRLAIEQTDGSQLTVGTVSGKANLTALGEASLDIEGPLELRTGKTQLEASWEKMSGFVDATLDGGFDLTSVAFTNLNASLENITMRAQEGTGLLRPRKNQEGKDSLDLESTVMLSGITANGSDTLDFKPFAVELDAVLKDGYRDLVTRQLPPKQVFSDGAKGEIRKAKFELPDGGKLILGGPLDLDVEGMLSGTVTIGLSKPDSVIAWARSISPVLEQPVSLLAQSIAGMGTPKSFGSDEVRSIELTVDRGEVRLGFIKLIDLPPLK